MRDETPQPSNARIDKPEGDHRRSTRDGGREKERELIHEIADGRAAAIAPLVNLCRENVLRNGERFAEEMNLVVLGLKKVVPRILQEEIHLHETRANVIERVPAAIADVILFN